MASDEFVTAFVHLCGPKTHTVVSKGASQGTIQAPRARLAIEELKIVELKLCELKCVTYALAKFKLSEPD